MDTKTTSASVKIMRSFDYSHFEVCLSIANDDGLTTVEIDDARKKAQRLADKAVDQYKTAKKMLNAIQNVDFDRMAAEQEVNAILAHVPESELTPEQKAYIKRVKDDAYWESRLSKCKYDYDDDFDEDAYKDGLMSPGYDDDEDNDDEF